MGEDRLTSRGCFFCKTGKEKDVVQRFETSFPHGRAVAPTRSKYRRTKDTATEERVSLLPGYVFFEVETDGAEEKPSGTAADAGSGESLSYALQTFSRTDGVLKLLRYTDGSWQLQGYDDRFAKMMFESGGNIGISQAYFDIGRRIRIQSGFLKDYEGSIVRVNKKTRTVELRIDLQGKKVSLRLGYEQIADVSDGPIDP